MVIGVIGVIGAIGVIGVLGVLGVLGVIGVIGHWLERKRLKLRLEYGMILELLYEIGIVE